jgi:hypothetical protein
VLHRTISLKRYLAHYGRTHSNASRSDGEDHGGADEEAAMATSSSSNDASNEAPPPPPPPVIFSKIPAYSPLFVRSGIPPRDFVPSTVTQLLSMASGRYYNISSYQFSVGVPRSGAAWHYHTDAAAVLLHGEKRWFFRDAAHSVLSSTPPGTLATSSRGHDNGDVENDDARVLECIQGPGDVVIVPNRVGHATLNGEGRVSVGLTFELAGRRIMEPFHVDVL